MSKLLRPTLLGFELSPYKRPVPRGSGFKFVADGWILLLMRFGHEKSRGIEFFIGNLQPQIFPETKKMEKVANLSAKPFLVEKLPVVNLTRFFAAERAPGSQRDSKPRFASWVGKPTCSRKVLTRR